MSTSTSTPIPGSISSTVPAAPGTGAAPNPPVMPQLSASNILVRAMKGYLYSPITKQLYYTHNRQAVGPSTYERPWSVNLGYGFEQPVYPLNPVDYATPATADAVLSWAIDNWPTLLFDIVAPTPDAYVTVPQYWLLVTNGTSSDSIIEVYSAGWWAFDHDKDGEAAAIEQRTADLKLAGFSV